MSMKFVSAERVGDTLIVTAHPDCYPGVLCELRLPIGPITERRETVEAGSILLYAGQYTRSISVTDACRVTGLTAEQFEAVCVLVGAHPLPPAPECPSHRYENTMSEVSAGIWGCSRCIADAAKATVPA